MTIFIPFKFWVGLNCLNKRHRITVMTLQKTLIVFLKMFVKAVFWPILYESPCFAFCEFLIQKFVVKRSNNGGLQPIIGLLAWKLIFQAFYALLKADCKIKQRKIFFFSFIAHKFVRTFTFVFLRTFLFRRIVWKESAKSLTNPSFVKVFTATFMATL